MRIYNTTSLNHAKAMRKTMTNAEKHIWFNCLKYCGFKFRRQRPFGPYIVDFYCAELKLVIEIDGETHYKDESIIYDKTRTSYLESLGLNVLRFTNTEVLSQIDDVKQKLSILFKH
jgi:very-short-patch-repair endonuclease